MSSTSMHALLQRFPNFATQWKACQQKMSNDGVLAAAEPMGADAKQKLAAANQRWLSAQTLLRTLEQHVEETYADSLPGAHPPATSTTTSEQASAEVVLKALQVLKASQRLRLPPGLQSQAGAPPDAGAPGPSSASGSLDHLLGVQPADLLSANLPDLHAVQAAVKTLAPQVEARLVAEARRVARALHEILPSADNEADIGAALERKAAEVRGNRRELAGAFLECLEAGGQQLLQLQQHASTLLTLLASCKLQRQAHVDKVHAKYKLEHAKALSKKAEHAEAALLIQTYILPKGLLATLRHLASLVRAAHTEASASFQKLRKQLAAYEELGPEFEGLVQEYRGLQEELQQANEHVQSMLAIQRELEAEAAG